LVCRSRKRRTSALFSSTDTEFCPPWAKSTFRRRVRRSQTMLQPTMHSGTLVPSVNVRFAKRLNLFASSQRSAIRFQDEQEAES
jgi:hypothetical protein